MARHGLRAVSRKVLAFLERSERAAVELSRASGVHCPAGCGACCESPNVETTIAEMLPLAFAVTEEGCAGDVYLRAVDGPPQCVFYDSHGEGRGRCGRYPLRPGICRLFGFSSAQTKHGPALAFCRRHKQALPEATLRAEQAFAAGELRAPSISHHYIRLKALNLPDRLLEILPINAALARAIEIVDLDRRFRRAADRRQPKHVAS